MDWDDFQEFRRSEGNRAPEVPRPKERRCTCATVPDPVTGKARTPSWERVSTSKVFDVCACESCGAVHVCSKESCMLHINHGDFWVCPVSGRVGDTPVESGAYESGKHVVNMYDSRPTKERPMPRHQPAPGVRTPRTPRSPVPRGGATKTETKVLQTNSMIREHVERFITARGLHSPQVTTINDFREAAKSCLSQIGKRKRAAPTRDSRIVLTDLVADVITRIDSKTARAVPPSAREGPECEALVLRVSNMACHIYHKNLSESISKGSNRPSLQVFVFCVLSIMREGLKDNRERVVIPPEPALNACIPPMKTAQKMYNLDITKVTRLRRLLKECIV